MNGRRRPSRACNDHATSPSEPRHDFARAGASAAAPSVSDAHGAYVIASLLARGATRHADCTGNDRMSQTAPSGLHPNTQGERKFLLEAEIAGDIWLRASARLQPRLWDAGRPITYHRTTYFDTPDHAYYRGTGPVAQRVRVREYASAPMAGAPLELKSPCFLELKRSSHGRRSKMRLEVDASEIDRHLAQVGETLLPCLTTWYQRAALTDDTESIRITLDTDIHYCPPQQIGAPCGATPAAFARASSPILEIKTWGPLPGWLRALVRSIEEATDFSKFRAGMQAAGVCAGGLAAAAGHG